MPDFINEILKKFEAWFGIKVKLSEKTDKRLFKQGEIWWCSLGFNVGEEMFGKGKFFTRPVLIFKVIKVQKFFLDFFKYIIFQHSNSVAQTFFVQNSCLIQHY